MSEGSQLEANNVGVSRTISGDKLTFSPKVCEGDAPAFKGTVTVRMPTFPEHFALMDELDLEVDELGNVKTGKHQLKMLGKLAAKLPQYVVAFDITHLESGSRAQSLEAAWVDRSFDPVMSELTAELLNGFKPSKK